MARIPTIDTEIFPLNLGGNVFGWTADEPTSLAVLDAFADAGGNFVDTADVYSAWVEGHTGGESEAIIGRWLTGRGRRDDVLIATKVSQKPGLIGLAPETVRAGVEGSLSRLRTDHIDLYYAHRDDASQPIESIAAVFDALVREGKVRAIGMSNFPPERARAWLDHARAAGLSAPVAIQPEYNLVVRGGYERDQAPLAAEYSLAVFPYFALASGFLTGKYRSVADGAGQARGSRAVELIDAGGLAVIDALATIADARGVQPATVALAWLLAKGVTAPIASASRPDQLLALMAVAELVLSPQEVADLDAASAPFAG